MEKLENGQPRKGYCRARQDKTVQYRRGDHNRVEQSRVEYNTVQYSIACVTSSPALTKLPIKTPDFLDRISIVTYGYGIVTLTDKFLFRLKLRLQLKFLLQYNQRFEVCDDDDDDDDSDDDNYNDYECHE